MVLFIGNNSEVSSRALNCLGMPCIFTLDLPPPGLETHTHQNGNLGGCSSLDPAPKLVIRWGWGWGGGAQQESGLVVGISTHGLQI